MTTSSILQITHIEQSQSQKEVTANEAFEAFEDAICETLTVSLASGNATITQAQSARALVLNATGVATSGRTITVPQIKRMFLVKSDSANTNNISIVRGSTSVVVAPGALALLHTDGTTNGLQAITGSTEERPYDIGAFYPGTPTADAVVIRMPMTRAVSFPAGLTGSAGSAGTAATAQTDFDVQKNGSSFGTMRFAAAGTVATFISASGATFAAGDVLRVVAPNTPDATLANIGFLLKGVRI